MKSFMCVVLIAQAVLLQTAYSYVINAPCGPMFSPSFLAPSVINPSIISPSVIAPPVIRAPGPVYSQTVVQPNSVANSLADTLSLLTVSSLLAETLPLPTPVLPMSTLPLGCGCGYPSTFLI